MNREQSGHTLSGSTAAVRKNRDWRGCDGAPDMSPGVTPGVGSKSGSPAAPPPVQPVIPYVSRTRPSNAFPSIVIAVASCGLGWPWPFASIHGNHWSSGYVPVAARSGPGFISNRPLAGRLPVRLHELYGRPLFGPSPPTHVLTSSSEYA